MCVLSNGRQVDSGQFLVMRRREEQAVADPEITLRLNWFDELRRRVPR